MKKILTGVLLLAFAIVSVAQQLTPAQQKIKDDLLAKSKSQKTTGHIMLGGGVVAIAAGIAVFADNFDIFSHEPNPGETGGVILTSLGGAAMIGSIFFYTAASRTKREAERIGFSFKMEKCTPFMAGTIRNRFYPAISVQWKLR